MKTFNKILTILLILASFSYATPAYAVYGLTKSSDLESGSVQYLSRTDALQVGLDLSGDFTIEGWVNRETIGALVGIVNKGNAGTPAISYRFIATGGNLLQVLVTSDGSTSNRDQIETDAADFTVGNTGTWVYIAATYDLSARDAIIYSGTTKGSITEAASTRDIAGTMASIYNSDQPVEVGARTGANTFDGKMSLIRIWDDIRTEADLEANMCNVFGTATSNMASEWSLNDVYTDASGNSNTLTATNAPVFATDVPAV